MNTAEKLAKMRELSEKRDQIKRGITFTFGELIDLAKKYDKEGDECKSEVKRIRLWRYADALNYVLSQYLEKG